MPIRFRRTFKILPGVKINVSKGGISTTVGGRGFNLNFSKRGVRQTIGLPGSGLSQSSYLIKNDDDDNDNDRDRERKRDSDRDNDQDVGCFPWGCLIFILIAAVIAYLIANALGWIPSNYLSDLLMRFTQWMREAGF